MKKEGNNLNILVFMPKPILATRLNRSVRRPESVKNGEFCNFQFAQLHLPHHFKHSREHIFHQSFFCESVKVINLWETSVLAVLRFLIFSGIFS